MSDRDRQSGFTFSWRSAEHGFTPLRRSAEHGFMSSWRSAEHGFTLIELMVALAIFSLMTLALLRLQGTTLSSTAMLADRAVGQIVVHNLGVEVLTDPTPPAFGEATGSVVNAGRTWRWTRNVKRTDDARLARIDFVVTNDSGRNAGSLSLARPL